MSKYVTFSFLTIFFFLQSNSQSLSGYTLLGSYNGHSYYLSQTGYQWVNADNIAKNLGGHLATISSNGENTFIQNAIAPLSISPWIGFNDLANKGSYVWSDGEPNAYTNWDINEPSNTGGVEDCAVIYYWNGKWNDGNPLTYDQFVLEFDNNSCPLIFSSLRNGLVAYYPFCGNALDASGNSNNGTLNNAALTIDRFGNANSAIQLNTSDALMCSTNSYVGPQTFTIAIWLKTTAQDYRRIVVFDNSQCSHINNWDRTIFITNGQAGFYVYPGSEQLIIGGPNVADGQWHQLVATLDNAGMKLYVDGNLVSSNTSITAAQNFSGYWRMGGFQNTTASGSYDDLIIYNRALTASEVAQLYQPNITLPVLLNEFSAFLFNQQVKLVWNTFDENGLQMFEIEKSADGTHFAKIKQVNPGQKTYSYLDLNALEKNFYRLKMINTNGSVSYSKVIMIKTKASSFEIYPNPTKDNLNIQFNASAESTNIRIQDQIGRPLKTIRLSTNKGVNATTIEMSHLQTGIYFISVNGEVKKIIKE